jgi:hypothetical protein
MDFAVRVPAACFSEARSALDRILSRNEVQLSCGEFQGYIVPSLLDVSVQLVQTGSQYDTFEVFLLVLRTDADVRNAYNRLKSEWNGRAMSDDRTAKSVFIEAVLAGRHSQG